MSTMSFSDLTSILFENYGSLITDTVVQQGPGNWLVPGQSVFGRLRELGQVKMGGSDGNNRFAKEWGVHTGTASAVAIDENDPFPSATQESYGEASLGWKRVVSTMEFDNLVRLATKANSARGGISPISEDFKRKLKAIVHKIESDLGTDGSGTSGKDVTGCKSFLATANTYAGIDQSANAWWRSAVTDASSAALSLTLLDTVMGAMWDRNAVGPNCEIWMSRTQWNKYVGLFSTNLRYAPKGSAAQSVEARYDNGIVDLPIHVLKAVEADEIWVVNTDQLELRFLDHVPEDQLSEIKDDQVMFENMPVGFEQISTGKDKKAIALKAYVQLCCENPYHTGALINLAT